MSSTSATTPLAKAPRTRSRAKKACKVCNARRVRCNVMDEQPCKNCRLSDVSCELIQSRRGKYERHPKYTRPRAATHSKASDETSGTVSESIQDGITPVADNGYANSYRYHASNSGSPGLTAMKDAGGSAPTPGFHTTPPSSSSPSTAVNGADSTVFLGESSSISLVHTTQTSSLSSDPLPGDASKLRYPIPDAVSFTTSISTFEARRRAARMEYLRQGGAFAFPPDDSCEVLLEAYFSWFHPNFPILDRHAFFNSYITKTVSPILLQAVLFVGMTHCNEKVVEGLGFPDRQEARNTLYNHAKDLYDADYESDKITVTQALFLMSFWRAGPLLEKDTRHWLGAAISLAQTKGIHRSSPATFHDRKLRKRIWWSLYIRDRQCSAALGLPTRIRDEDCDLEMLEPDDFEEDDSSPYPEFLGRQKREHILFNIQTAKLAIYLGKIVLREFAPVSLPKSDSERAALQKDLEAWERELSPEMTANATASSFWASMLHLSYNNLYILLYRSAYLAAKEGSEQDVGNIALQAACRNTRIIEDVLSQDLVQRSTVYTTTSLFNSLCIHTICLRRSTSTARKLAEYRAQLCLLGLRELQKTWDVTNWVLQLFLQFLDQSTAKKLDVNVDHEDHQAQAINTTMGTSQSTEGAENTFLSGPNLIMSPSNLVRRADDVGPRDGVGQGLDFASQLFGSKEAEDFSMFQLQPDLFSGDFFGAGLDQYYSSMLPRGEGSTDGNHYR